MQPEYAPLLVNVKVTMPALALRVCVAGVTGPPVELELQVPESAAAVIAAVELVTRLPLTS